MDFQTMPQAIARRITTVNSLALQKLGEDIKRVGSLNNYRDAQLISIKLSGQSMAEINNQLSKASQMTIPEIERLYADAARYDYEFATQFYLSKGINQIPFAENIPLQRMVRSMAAVTVNSYYNLSGSYAWRLLSSNGVKYTSLAAGYKEAIDKAVTSVSLGVTDYRTEMRRVLKQYADSGIRRIDWESGYCQRLDTAVRRNVMDGMRQVSIETQRIIGEEFGADGYEISAHVNPAPDHAPYQGRQYTKTEYDTLNDSLKRRFGTLNCYHTVKSIVLGVSPAVYSDAELKEMQRKSAEKIKIDGKEYTRYQCTQLLRKLETATRKQKDRITLFEAAGDNEAVISAKREIRLIREQYDNVVDLAGLNTHYDRMSIVK